MSKRRVQNDSVEPPSRVTMTHVGLWEALVAGECVVWERIEALKFKGDRGYFYTGNTLKLPLKELVALGYVVRGVHPSDNEVAMYYRNPAMSSPRDALPEDGEDEAEADAGLENEGVELTALPKEQPAAKKTKTAVLPITPVTGGGVRGDGVAAFYAQFNRPKQAAATADDEQKHMDEMMSAKPAPKALPWALKIDELTRQQKPRPDFGFAVTLDVDVAGAKAGEQAKQPVRSELARPRSITLRKLNFNAADFDNDRYGNDDTVQARFDELKVGGPGLRSKKQGVEQVYAADGSVEILLVPAYINKGTKQFPVQVLVQNKKLLWCTGCNCPVNANNSVVMTHVQTTQHQSGLKKIANTIAQWKGLQKWLAHWRTKNRGLHGDTVCEVTDLHRFKIARTLMGAGVPLSKVDDEDFRALLEKDHGGRLTSASWLRHDYIKPNQIAEISRIKAAIGTANLSEDIINQKVHLRPVSVIFDGSTLVDQVLAVVFRFVLDDLTVVEVLVRLSKYEVCRCAEELINAIVEVMLIYGITSGQVLSWMRDRCSVNTAAIPDLIKKYGGFDGECFSHTLNNCDKLDAPVMKEFCETLFAAMRACGGVNKFCAHWKKKFNRAADPPGVTRWFATAEKQFYLTEYYAELVEAILTAEGDGEIEQSKRLDKLKAVVLDPEQQIELYFEFGVGYIINRAIVQACYQLEGHSPALSLVAHTVIQNLEEWLNSNAVTLSFDGIQQHIVETARKMVEAQDVWIAANKFPLGHEKNVRWTVEYSSDKWKQKAFEMIKPLIEYFNAKFNAENGELKKDRHRFKVLQYANPLHMRNFQGVPPTLRNDVATLQWPPFDAVFAERMNAEMSGYIERCRGAMPAHIDDRDPKKAMERIVQFWSTNYIDFPAIAEFVKYAYTSTTSSASVERVFSLLKRTFNMSQMSCALEDYVETSMMLMFNKPFIKRFSHILA